MYTYASYTARQDNGTLAVPIYFHFPYIDNRNKLMRTAHRRLGCWTEKQSATSRKAKRIRFSHNTRVR